MSRVDSFQTFKIKFYFFDWFSEFCIHLIFHKYFSYKYQYFDMLQASIWSSVYF